MEETKRKQITIGDIIQWILLIAMIVLIIQARIEGKYVDCQDQCDVVWRNYQLGQIEHLNKINWSFEEGIEKDSCTFELNEDTNNIEEVC